MKNNGIKRLLSSIEIPSLAIGVLAFVYFSLTTPKFFTAYNVGLMSNQMAVYGLLGSGLTLVIIVGGMDISIGATLSICCTATGMIWEYAKGMPNEILFVILGALASIAIGMVVGMLLGVMITFFRIPDMVASLALQRVTRGIAIMFSKAAILCQFPTSVYKLGIARFLGIGLPFWIFAVFTLVLTVMLRYTRFGRRIYMMGNNVVAARLAGINVARTRFLVYTTEGLIIGLSSVVYLAYNFYAQAASTGGSIQTYVLAAALMGGASMSGGKGTALGTLCGAFTLGVVMNGLVHAGVNADAVDIVIALMIMMVLLAQFLINRADSRINLRGGARA